MPRLCNRDNQALRDITQALATVHEGDGPVQDRLAEPIRSMFGTQHFVAYSIAPHHDRLELTCMFGAGYDVQASARLVGRYLASAPISFLSYNPSRPEPWQRNRPLHLAELVRDGPTPQHAYRDGLRALLGTDNQLRVLLCEGESLLSWTGIFQPDAFTPRHRMLLNRLIGPLRKRLIVERLLGDAAGMNAAIDAAFEAISAPAFLLGPNGTIRHANASGLATLEADHDIASLLRERAVRPTRPGWPALTPVRSPSGSVRYLAVLRHRNEVRNDSAIAQATRAWQLTRRQADVLRLLVEGHANTGICAHLGLAPRTVEDHIRVMFNKAGVGRRAELVAKVLGGGRP